MTPLRFTDKKQLSRSEGENQSRSGVRCAGATRSGTITRSPTVVATAAATHATSTGTAALATGKSSVGCSPCAQPLLIAAATQTVPHHAFATGATSSSSNKIKNGTRRFTLPIIQTHAGNKTYPIAASHKE